MPFAAEAARTAIRETVEAVGTAMFAYGTFAGQPIEAMQAMARQTSVGTHRFDVEFGDEEVHASSPVSARDARRVLKVAVTIPLITHVATTAQEAERALVLNAIASDADDAAQALAEPGALEETAAAVATEIVSGMMFGPSGDDVPTWQLTSEDWDRQIIRSAITGRIVVATEG